MAAGALGALVGAATAADGVQLRLAATDRVELRIEVEERIGDNDVVRQGQERFSISIAPGDGDLLATITLESARGELRTGLVTRAYDTETSDGPAPTGFGRPRRPVVVRLSTRGDVLALVSVDGEPPERAAGSGSRELFELTRLEHLTRGAVMGLQVPYPGEPVDVGASWTSHCVRGLPGVTAVRADVQNVVVERDANRLVVVQDGDGEAETRGGGRAWLSVRGRMVVSTRDGLPLEGEARVSYTLAGRAVSTSTTTTRRWSRVVPARPAPPQPGAY